MRASIGSSQKETPLMFKAQGRQRATPFGYEDKVAPARFSPPSTCPQHGKHSPRFFTVRPIVPRFNTSWRIHGRSLLHLHHPECCPLRLYCVITANVRKNGRRQSEADGGSHTRRTRAPRTGSITGETGRISYFYWVHSPFPE